MPSLKLDVVHTHHPVLLGQTAARKADEFSLPLVFTFHTQYREYTHYFPLPQETIQNFLKDAVDNWLKDYMRMCQHIVIPSESMKRTLINDYGLKGRYTVVPTGIDLQPYLSADGQSLRASQNWQDEIVMVSIGRLAPEKNWTTLLQAIRHAHSKHPQLRLLLIGDGPEKDQLQDLADQLGIADKVTFAGQIPFSEVPRYLKAADLFGFASTTETQGLVTMEAMAAGLPIVAVDGSGTRDILEDGRQGYLVPDDAEALASATSKLLGNAEALEQFGLNALEKAKTFDVNYLAKRLLDVYEEAIQARIDNQYVIVED